MGGVFWGSKNDSAGIHNKIGVFYFLALNCSFSISVPMASNLPLERGIIKRDRAAGAYYAHAAYIARVLVSLPIDIFFTVIFAISVYFMVGFESDFGKITNFTLLVNVHVVSATAMGMLIGSVVKTQASAQIIAPFVVALFALFGGNIVNLENASPFLSW
jgi:ABC-type multidrug transport system permease subunit